MPSDRSGSSFYAPSTYTHASQDRASSSGAAGDGKRARRPRRARDIISTVLIIVGVALLLTAAGLFIHAQLGYKQAQDSYAKLDGYAKVAQTAQGTVDPIPAVDFDALSAINPDLVGWIYVPGTNISYPVVQTDDNSTYLTKLFDGTWNASGSIFMDMDATKPGLVDQQTTLYGHHMNDGTMFNLIDKTIDQAEFDKIGNVYYITRDTTYTFKPMLTAQVDDTYGDARTPNFSGDATLSSYLTAMLDKAKAKASDASERVASTQQVLTLVTCATAFSPTTIRSAMVCTLTASVPTSQATVQGQ